MDGMTINHIVSIDHGSYDDDIMIYGYIYMVFLIYQNMMNMVI